MLLKINDHVYSARCFVNALYFDVRRGNKTLPLEHSDDQEGVEIDLFDLFHNVDLTT
jgi:hypothetical protein